MDQDVNATLQKPYSSEEGAAALAARAKGILGFPRVVKAGLMVGGQFGDGALRTAGKTVGYYNLVSASYGLRFGAQAFAYVLLFMTDTALAYPDRSEGFEVGVGPSGVVADKGFAKTLRTTTAHADIYAFIFDQAGAMAGLGLQGSKITKINP
jgi:lipid-binding SYLF domain-containing protein